MINSTNEKIFPKIREITAILLWELGAIKVDLENPFKLVSGNYSPIYINCRKVISDTTFMQLFTAFSSFILKSNEIVVDVVAGGETAGIPFAAYVAESHSLPMVYVRKKTKAHGIASLVEGNIQNGFRVILIEDLITDGRSKIDFIAAIRDAGGIIKEALVLFDRLQGGRETLEKEGIRLHSIVDMKCALKIGKEVGYMTKKDLQSITEYLQDPVEWHNRRNLKYIGAIK